MEGEAREMEEGGLKWKRFSVWWSCSYGGSIVPGSIQILFKFHLGPLLLW